MARMVLPFVLFCIITPAILFSMPTESYGSGNGSMPSGPNNSFSAAGCGDSRLSHCGGTQECRTNGKQFANLTSAL